MGEVYLRKGVSIIVCCYNSEARLPETLWHIAQQVVPSTLAWEVIVVDNASTDCTSEAAHQIWHRLNCVVPFRVVSEPIPGLSNARLKGFKEANYQYLILCDDDNWLNENYIHTAYQLMNENHRIGGLGGWGQAVSKEKLPFWFEACQLSYAVGKQHSYNGKITQSKGYVYGAGMVVNKRAWLDMTTYGYQSVLTDRKGGNLSSGGDVELCYALQMIGYDIHYSDELSFKHFIPESRLEWNYVKRLFSSFAKADIFLDCWKYFLDNESKLTGNAGQIYDILYKDIVRKILHRKKSLIRLLLYGIEEGRMDVLFTNYYFHQLSSLFLQKKRLIQHLNSTQLFIKQARQCSN